MKSKSNKKYILFALGALILVGIVIGVSYAIWQITLVQTEQNVVNADCFSVTLENEENDINIQTAFPITDEEGSALTPYTFTIKNNCNSKAAYEVNLESLNTTTLDAKYVKAKVDNVIVNLGSVTSTDDVTVANATKSYKISTGYLKASESKVIKLNLWMDYDTPAVEESMNKIFEAKMVINASYSSESSSDTAVKKITELAQTDTTNLATDDYGNIRYIGSNPNNYVSIDGDIWRIIGTMKDIDDGTGNKSDRVKLIRSESIGGYSWDTSESSVNGGKGVNEWSGADLMKLLNPGYESELVGGSLYWNNQSGTCYSDENNVTTSCNFTSTGIKDKLKTLISDAVWNTGANDGKTYTYNNIITSKFYELERSSNTGKICSSGNYCNDTVERTTTWKGLVGLMYPSDYGYATSGGSTTDRATCLNTDLWSWDSSSASDCKNNDWLFNNSYQWTISPFASFSIANAAFGVDYLRHVGSYSAYNNNAARPVVYLKSSVKISGGEGTSESPFSLEL